MNFDEFNVRLAELGVNIPPGTLRRWISEGIMIGPKRYKKGKGGGKGRAMDWPDAAIRGACAVWAVRNAGVTKKPLSTKRIHQIIQKGSDIYDTPNATYSSTQFTMTGPYPSTEMELTDLTMKFSDDEELDKLTVIWIAAAEKARNRWPMSRKAKVKFCWHSELSEDEKSSRLRQYFVLDDIELVESTEDEIAIIVDGENTLDSLNSGRWFNRDRMSELGIRNMINETDMLWRKFYELREEIDELHVTMDKLMVHL